MKLHRPVATVVAAAFAVATVAAVSLAQSVQIPVPASLSALMSGVTGLVLGNGSNPPTAYAGSSCTTQTPMSQNASGVWSCVTPGGDLGGTWPNSTVAKIQGNTVTQAGSWTPIDNSGQSLVFTSVTSHYDRLGNTIHAYFQLTYPTASAGNASVSGLPVAVPNVGYASAPAPCFVSGNPAVVMVAQPVVNTSTLNFVNASSSAQVPNTTLASKTVSCMLTYPAS